MKKERKKTENEELTQALIKKAMGFCVDETVKEYQTNEETGEVKLIKKKVTTKFLPPDVAAAKALLELFGERAGNLNNLSDSELEEEKQRLLNLLKKLENTKEEEEECSLKSTES